ncbi:MAG: hypothetical protein M0R32_05800 [Candidatus Cloacimonetes bacterium]|jgi:hypothetical protein|nr:hypothetical protein [Candidatus Cloacimonadota bacterium]
MKIATVNNQTGEKQYMEGKPMEWKNRPDAENQVRLLKLTCGSGPSEPRNFQYLIEP